MYEVWKKLKKKQLEKKHGQNTSYSEKNSNIFSNSAC